MRPIVALLTDFGSQDHYVGAVRGAVLAACPDATVTDIAHDLPPHDVMAGAFALAAAYRVFPAGTTFMAVVDPGVGGSRRGIAIEAGGYKFVGPDNGIFTFVYGEHEGARVHEVTNAGLFRHEVSPTFHARDIFGPVAALLARGLELEHVGPVISDPVRLDVPEPRAREDGWEAEVLHVDRFGNLITNFTRAHQARLLERVGGDPTEVVVVVEGAVLPLVHTYGDVVEGEPCALVGSSGRLEIAIHRASASRVLGAVKGATVRLRVVQS